LYFCAVSFGGIVAGEMAGLRATCQNDFDDIQRALDTIEDPWERAAVSRQARRMAETIVNERWDDLCRAAERLAQSRWMGAKDVRRSLAPARRAA
jgi:hypothetical protein